jgi:hypothetical protein
MINPKLYTPESQPYNDTQRLDKRLTAVEAQLVEDRALGKERRLQILERAVAKLGKVNKTQDDKSSTPIPEKDSSGAVFTGYKVKPEQVPIKQTSRPRVVYICGTPSRPCQMGDLITEYALGGIIVLTLGKAFRSVGSMYGLTLMLDMQRKEIDMADSIIVMERSSGLLGAGVTDAVQYAKSLNKSILFIRE